jgi:hypothetical protein
VTTRTRRAPARRQAVAQASAVAPDVYTSSTTQTSAGMGARANTLPRTFRRRWSRERPRCRGSARLRSSASLLAIPQSDASARASALAGTSPRCQARSGSPGTGTRSATSGCGTASATSVAASRASRRRPRSCRERRRVRVRRRRSPTEPRRSRASDPRTRHSGARATDRASRSARTAGGRGGSVRGDRSRRVLPPAARRRRSARAARGREPARLDRTDESLTPSCQIGAETSSRRSSSARSRSAGVLIGRNRPRGPRRGTSRYCASTNAETSWYSRSSCTAGRPSTSFST